MAQQEILSVSEILSAATLLDRLAQQSGSVASPELKASWRDLERHLLLGLRAEERAASNAGTSPLPELRAIAGNEHIRNLVWEVSISLELESPPIGALRKLAGLLRARAQGVQAMAMKISA